MLQLIMLLLLIISSAILLRFFKRLLKEKIANIKSKVEDKQLVYDQMFSQDDQLHKKIFDLEGQASGIFALYEMTKDISKTLKEQEACAIFKDKLKTHMTFEDCKIVESSIDAQALKDYFIFPLKSQQRDIGSLVIKGISESDRDMFSVLANQFSLGLNRIHLYERIEQLSITDSLTKLFTRRHCLARFSEELSRTLKHKLHLSFLMIDIDDFKSYNDKFGHLVGDVILREVAKAIKSNLREIDLVGRYGGEEFLAILTDTNKQGARFVAERIRDTVQNREIRAYDEKLKVTISIGIATCPEDAKEAEELLDKSDWCLYRAKKMGKNQVCVYGQYK